MDSTGIKSILLKPRMSEKTYALYNNENTYVFIVPNSANKMTVSDAVAAQYGVEVVDVRILLEKGKKKRSYKGKNRPIFGKRSDVKKAYVKLKEGHSLPIFAAVDEAEKKAKKAQKSNKKESK